MSLAFHQRTGLKSALQASEFVLIERTGSALNLGPPPSTGPLVEENVKNAEIGSADEISRTYSWQMNRNS